MEHDSNHRIIKKLAVFSISVLVLGLLLVAAAYVNPMVEIPDRGLRGAVRIKLDRESGPIYKKDLMQITELDASSQDIVSLEGLQYFKRLAVLNLANNEVSDLSLLSGLPMLRELNLSGNRWDSLQSVNFDQITHLPIRILDISQNQISSHQDSVDLDYIAKLDQLEQLYLGNNQVHDFSFVASLSNLSVLDLSYNQIEDISTLNHASNVSELNLRGNLITDIRSLAGFTELTYLNIHSNPIDTGLDSLANLVNLQTLIMANVYIGEEYDFLRSLTQLQKLNIRNTSILDLSVLVDLIQLGALQDDPAQGKYASVNLLELRSFDIDQNPYLGILPFWENIAYRYPLSLPNHPSSVPVPKFSHQSGFYEQGFFLELVKERVEGSIYYTLDGSEPSPWSLDRVDSMTYLYTEPIWIKNRTDEENQLSNIITSSVEPYYLPESNVFKGTVVRAITVDNEDFLSDVETMSYFISDEIKTRYTFPVVSIAADPAGLFDSSIGIYVLGDGQNSSEDGQPSIEDGNSNQHGMKWERPIHLDMFSPSGEHQITLDAGMRIHGGSTRYGPQKSLRLYAGEQYSSESSFRYNFFPSLNDRVQERSVDTFSTLILRSGGNEWGNTFIRDELAHQLLLPTKLDIQDFQPVILFINGEYWGIHTVRNRYDENYFSAYYDIPVEELAILENNSSIKFGSEEDRQQYLDIWKVADLEFSSNHYQTVDILSDPAKYQLVAELIDIDNFIGYYIAQIYFGNTDWPGNNVLYWRKTINDSENLLFAQYGQDGKWRWAILDVDWGFRDPSRNTLFEATRDDGEEWYNKPWATYLIRILLENGDFKIQFINQFADSLNTIFREEVVVDKTEEMEQLYVPEFQEHVDRWGNGRYQAGSVQGWMSDIATIKEFALLRPSHQREHIIEYFGLPGIFTVTTHTDISQGYIQLNSIDVVNGGVGVDDPENWSGIYFQDIPIRISAVPNPGYQFSHWETSDIGDELKYSPVITITSVDDIELWAIFIKD